MEGGAGEGREEERERGIKMLFGPGILISAGATIVMAVLDKSLDDMGYQWMGTALRLLLPIAGFALGIYFLENNPIIGWLR